MISRSNIRCQTTREVSPSQCHDLMIAQADSTSSLLLLKLLRHSSTMRQPSHEYRRTAASHPHRSMRGSTIIQLGCAGCTENSTQLQCRHSADAHHHQACSPRACSLVASRLDTIQFASPGCHDSARNDLLTTAPSAPLALLAMVLLVTVLLTTRYGPTHHCVLTTTASSRSGVSPDRSA